MSQSKSVKATSQPKTLVILPHQLFDPKPHLTPYKSSQIILWEHPHYFKHPKYKYNQKRLLLHRASMQYYFNLLKSRKFKVRYVNLNQSPKLPKSYHIFDPIDKVTPKLPGKPTLIESPNFLLTKEHYAKYRKKTQKYFFNAFYMWGKKELKILPKVKSQDKLNRKSMPKTIKIPKLPSNQGKLDQKHIKAGKTYVTKHFKRNYGNLDNFVFPVTHQTARKWLTYFVKHKLDKFGMYQDAIRKDESYMFHSVLSTSINIGLLNPMEVVEALLKQHKKKKVPMNSLEGFIRQLFWREYQRYCYIYNPFGTKNFFGNRKKLTKAWYEGSLGIEPVDNAIKRAFDTGYLHHIERLMVIGNYMNLSGISPREGYKWFMEFSCDSYEWVMHQNVLDMVFFVTGGATMRRPYVSSSNYILKMSNYPKGDWADEWDQLYRAFLKRHKQKLHKFRYYFRGLKSV